ncbi:MAG TPA: methylmalonyl-CoA mutase family protein [Acidimicrobiia bacterium]|nr:methylmalonyl-CoA mutase family protein [Acidimicrobiia bacterium]
MEAWTHELVADALASTGERREDFRTASGFPLKRIYTPADVDDLDYLEDLGFPGQYPFTRGAYPTMYRGRLWTMRQIAGYGTAEDTNDRFRYLISQGQTGLSIDFDMPTLMGFDSDHELSHGEVGREGVAIDTLDDMRVLFDGIDLESISVSMTINPTAWILFAMYVAVAEERGNDPKSLSGTVQADILKEYVAQKEWIYPIAPSMRLARDIITYASEHLPRYNPISISGYHISEAGASAVQELSYTIAHAIEYLELVTAAGVDIDDFAPRLSFFFVAQADLFEEVAKFRAARRVWARIVTERFGARRPESARLRFHCQTAAATLTKNEPYNNIVRTTLQALAAVLGGAQSLHCNGFDEAYAIPTEQAMRLALRTQQIIAEESGVADVIDPLGGSYLVESLTGEMETAVHETLEAIAAEGGTIRAIEEGRLQAAIGETAYTTQLKRTSGERVVVGVNRYVADEPPPEVPTHRIRADVEQRQIARLHAVRSRRNGAELERLNARLREAAAHGDTNLLPVTIDLVKAGATVGEIVEELRPVFGSYRPPAGW